MQVVVISWEGHLTKALEIATAMTKEVETVTVVHSEAGVTNFTAPSQINIVSVPNTYFFGQKFKVALDLDPEAALLLIQADATSDDWGGLLSRFRHMLSLHPIGVWAPDIHHTSWVTNKVRLRDLSDDGLIQVTQTDAIVIGLSPKIVKKLSLMNFEENNLGWGVDWAAIVSSIAAGLLVVRDPSIRVGHVAGSGYDHRAASSQQEKFLRQLNDAELAILSLLRRNHQLSRRGVRLVLRLNDLVDSVVEFAVRLAKSLTSPRRGS